MTTISSYTAIGVGDANLNSLRAVLNQDAPTFDPMTEYLSMDWTVVRASSYFQATSPATSMETIELVIVQPLINPSPNADTAAILAEAPGIPLNYHFMTDPTEQLMTWHMGQHVVVPLTLSPDHIAYSYPSFSGTCNIYSTDQFPVVIFGTSAVTGKSLVLICMVEYTWSVFTK